MASVWFLGAGTRKITAAQWASAGVAGASDSVWSSANGWSIPTTSFTAPQLTLLAADGHFNVSAPDGPRPFGGSAGPAALDLSGYLPRSELNEKAALALLQAGPLYEAFLDRIEGEALNPATVVGGAITAAVNAANLGHVPGAELGYIERTTPANSTATTVTATVLGGLQLPAIIGAGRPVDIDFFAPNCYHSVASTAITFFLIVNGVTLGSSGQACTVSSVSTTVGRATGFKRRLVLTNAVSYTFAIGAFAGAAGTFSMSCATFSPAVLSATSR